MEYQSVYCEYLIQFENYSFVVLAENSQELYDIIALRLNKKYGHQYCSAENLILQQLHGKFNTYYDVDENEMPREGVIKASLKL